jgi:hypothetical protein
MKLCILLPLRKNTKSHTDTKLISTICAYLKFRYTNLNVLDVKGVHSELESK